MNQIETGMNTALDPDLMEGKKKRETHVSPMGGDRAR
jgi:hypothetical protein